LILDTLEMGTMREPFKGKRLAIPVKSAREGGTFAGKVKTQFWWSRLGLGRREAVQTRRVKRRNGQTVDVTERRIYGRGGIYLVHSRKGPNTLYVWKSQKGQKSQLLYKVGAPKKMKKKLQFFATARRAIYRKMQLVFDKLVANGGDDKALSGLFKYGKR